MKCEKCGEEIKGYWEFCNYCGNKLNKKKKKILVVEIKDILGYKIEIDNKIFKASGSNSTTIQIELEDKEYNVRFSALSGNNIKKLDFKNKNIYKIFIKSITDMNIKSIDEKIDETKFTYQDFITTNKIKNYLLVDEIHKYICIPHISFWDNRTIEMKKSKFYSFSKILSVELQRDGKCVASYTRGGLGSAIVGNVLFGPIGAIVGANTGTKKTKYDNQTEFSIIIKLKNISEPCVQIKIKYDEKIANEIVAVIEIILEQKNEAKQNKENDKFEEIKKFKELYDLGIITQDEFENKKKELLKI